MSLLSVRGLARDRGSAVGKTVLVFWVNSIRRGRLPPPPGFLLLVVGPSCNGCPLQCEQDGAGGLLGTRVRTGSGPGRFAVPFLQQNPGPIVVFALPLLPTRVLRAFTSF